MAIPKQAQDKLESIKANITTSYQYFKDNCTRFREFRKYVFRESITPQQKQMLQSLNRPVTEFNILEAYISRLLGEFAKQEPSIEISPFDGQPIPHMVLDVVEGHLRHIFQSSDKDGFSYDVYKDALSGGFSVAKVWTDYASPMSFEQQIYLERVFDPTMCGFDPLARKPSKQDGRYSFEIFPMLEEEFKEQFPKANEIPSSSLANVEGFKWSYKNQRNQKIVLVVDYYEKKKKKVKIVRLSNKKVLTEKDYERLQAYWLEQQFIEQIPVVVGSPRWTEIEIICNYKLTGNQVLEYSETDYSYLPHVFIDGHSIMLTEGTDNTQYQMTRPYVYHAKGIQDLKNFAGQCLANHLENMIQHKFIIKKEAIPQEQDFIEALNNIQVMSTVVVNAYSNNNPDKPIPEPIREIQNLPAPPEVMGAFSQSDPTTQMILGSYASNLGKNDNDLSGKAVIESASVGNAAAMPYVVGYLQGLTQIGTIIVDLIPKYLIGHRAIPVVKLNGDKEYQEINGENLPSLDYGQKSLKVNIEAGVNFQVQKNQALEQIIALSNAMPSFGEFMNSDQGLPILVKNLTIYGADELQEAVPQWLQQRQQAQQQQMQMQQQAMQSDPRMIKAQADVAKVKMQEQEIMAKQQQQAVENQLNIARLAIEKEEADAKILEAESRVTNQQVETAVRLEENETSILRHALDSATKMAELRQREEEHHLKKSMIQKDISRSDEGIIKNGEM